MNTEQAPELYQQCVEAFAKQLANTIAAVLKNEASLTPSQRESLLSSLLFSTCTQISGSSFAGRVNGEEIYPVLGFSHGESDETVHFGSNTVHEIVPSILRELKA
jgi:hypothetical protein